jgi:Mg-chelatase subunit ChlD
MGGFQAQRPQPHSPEAGGSYTGGLGEGKGASSRLASPAVRAEPALGLQGQIRQLQETHRRNVRRSVFLSLVSVVVFAALLTTIYLVYDYAVLSYAILDNVKVEQDPIYETRVNISFDVVKPGKVAFDRTSGKNHTEKLDVFATKGPTNFYWAWASDAESGIDFQVVYRSGWMRSTVAKHFALSGRKTAALDVVFILDITGSMQPFIDGLKKKCIEFADVVKRQGYDCRLGLIAFGDVEINEPFTIYPPTADVALFQERVANLRLLNGGDEPESTVEALGQALELTFRPEARVCFVHITDASCHHAERLPGVAAELQRRSITTYVVSREKWANLYNLLCVHGGRFFAIEEAKFEEILLNVARAITNQIKKGEQAK